MSSGPIPTPYVILIAGVLAFVLPPMIEVARFNWSTDQGGHGPLVLATGLWLLWREFSETASLREPGDPLLGSSVLIIFVVAYILTGITGVLELQAIAMYAALVAAFYLIVGIRVIRACWFPLVYLAFALPPPDTVVAFVTQPVKIAISTVAVSLLHAIGYPVGSSGVTIQIAQYELLVAAACSGLNSLISLSAICLFYVYMRYKNDAAAFVRMGLLVVPMAILGNLVRVLILILLTYHFGEAAAQGFLHDFAGIVTFAAALASLIFLDALYVKFRGHRESPAFD